VDQRALEICRELKTEYQMLSEGYNFAEISTWLGVPEGRVRVRCKRVHHLDLVTTFRRRIETKGAPCRLNVQDSFGYWFSGFFDGEGTLLIQVDGNTQLALKIQVLLRADDRSVNEHIKAELKCGRIFPHPARLNDGRNAKPGVMYRVQELRDLYEIIVPLFERYPLRSKKNREFEIWKNIVRHRYLETAGGAFTPSYTPEYRERFHRAMTEIRRIREYHDANAQLSERSRTDPQDSGAE
jgi:hypothetical protein